MIINKVKYLITFIFVFSFFTKSHSLEPNIFVQSTVNRASQILSDNISRESKIEELKKVALDTVDIRGIGFYTLGKFRKNLSDEQKQKYSKLNEIKISQ